MYKSNPKLISAFLSILITFSACSRSVVQESEPNITEAAPVMEETGQTAVTPAKETDQTNAIPAEETDQSIVTLTKEPQEPALLEEISQVLMKDNGNGWAIKKDGTLLSTDNAWKTYEEVYQFTWVDESIPDLSSIDNTLFVSGFLDGDSKIGIYRSDDEGATWKEGKIDYSGENGGACQLFISFIDKQNGYLLYLGGPALGLMTKILYKTEDGGSTFDKVADISYINGYPTGMAFNESGEGFISSTYHGNEDAYLYTSKDRGETWSALMVQPPEAVSYSYIDGYPVCFTGEKGYLILKFMSDQPSYVMYCSLDQGKTWTPDTTIPTDELILDYSICDETTIYFTDYAGDMFKSTRGDN
jgi:photosystem II stability/assembly factor-like uncharacterized protein